MYFVGTKANAISDSHFYDGSKNKLKTNHCWPSGYHKILPTDFIAPAFMACNFQYKPLQKYTLLLCKDRVYDQNRTEPNSGVE